METVLRTQGLTKTYAGKRAVDNLTMSVNKGDIYGFIGKNGAGKTTLIRMAVGLAAPSSGGIELFGGTDLTKQRSRVGTVIEYPAVFPYMTAAENLEAQCRLMGVKGAQTVQRTLKLVGLGDTGKKKAKNFSLGMKQRLAIALALIGDPEFLFLDEPINGLDPTGIREVRELILQLNREQGITVLISSHILGELSRLATRFGIIDNGRMVEEFTVAELEERCNTSLAIRCGDTLGVCRVLESILDTRNFRISGENTVTLLDHIEEAGRINTALVQAGLTIEDLHAVTSDLENYFIDAVGQERKA